LEEAQAKLFLKDGYRVFLSDLNLKGAREELKEYGEDRIGYFEMDVTKDEQVKAMTQVLLPGCFPSSSWC
jgi:NAD(P)-dependent dehydrogenase (short-subunit alcohol dehydrogenase family)